MDDRTLLELAAKAAGIPLHPWDGMDTRVTASEPRGAFWNPLLDDADALRLAVKLNIDIGFEGGVTLAIAGSGWHEDDAKDFGGDRFAATRRAIVRAAAEIGRNTAKGDGGGV